MKWNAWAPGVNTRKDWHEWAKNEKDFDLAQIPDVSFIKPMVRRRLSSLAKMVFATANQFIDEQQQPMPLVFASRYGEMDKTVQLLTQLCNQEGLSPTNFGLSVHNSLVGMFGLVKKWTDSSTAIGAGNKSVSAGLIEAYSQSKAIQAPVLYFYYDEALPKVYQQYRDGLNTPPICIGLIVDASDQAMTVLYHSIKKQVAISPIEFIQLLISRNV